MQFGEQQESTSKHQEGLIRISHEIRTRLNSMIGFLLLLVDNLADNPQERQELIADAYKSALKILNIIDVIDDMVSLEIKWQTQDANTQYPNLVNIAKEFHTDTDQIVNYLRLLDNNSQRENEFIEKALQSAICFLNNLENFENIIKVK